VFDNNRVDVVGDLIPADPAAPDQVHPEGSLLFDDGLLTVLPLDPESQWQNPEDGHHGKRNDADAHGQLHHGEAVRPTKSLGSMERKVHSGGLMPLVRPVRAETRTIWLV